MIKFLSLLLLCMVPTLVLAEGGMSFAPPPGDYSIIFLANIFGIVDGVLHGTGSQIMGAMFGVFNAAVLALGGVIIMYTLMVSTMNTAHEGQMLGQKWSSMWIPARSCMGLALLIPKASGYCLMQIFVMWLVVQGVGAADKVWGAALSYLNRGGVIVRAQLDVSGMSQSASMPTSSIANVNKAVISILSGQVCMLGLQKQLEAQRQVYQKQQACDSIKPNNPLYGICSQAVPDFLGSVSAVTVQGLNPSGASFSVQMPNFDSNTPYSALNGICGNITWNGVAGFANPVAEAGESNDYSAPGCTKNCSTISLTGDEYQVGQLSRAIAVQQMYMDLQAVAQTIVGNDPQMPGNNVPAGSAAYSDVAIQQFGVPYTSSNVVCKVYSDDCTAWGPVSKATSGVLLNGTEVVGAISDYYGIMMPTTNLMHASESGQSANDARKFLSQANSAGWIMAGAYFFDLVKLNGNAAANSKSLDQDSGLSGSTFTPGLVGAACDSDSKYPILCQWVRQNAAILGSVQALVDGTGVEGAAVQPPSPTINQSQRAILTNTKDSTVYGFLTNSLMVQVPNQPGLNKVKFGNLTIPNIDLSALTLPRKSFDCGGIRIVHKICFGRIIGNLFYNTILLNFLNTLLGITQVVMQNVLVNFMFLPLQGISIIFLQNIALLSKPGINPVVALASMGVSYINFASNLWMVLTVLAIGGIVIPVFGIFMVAVMGLLLPLVIAWLGVMVGIGFVTSYYVPLLPYMIFLFGSIAWLICVIEAMVAAPIVALGVTHPEGHDAFGKGEHAIMLMLNVFLRPSMMIIGYIAAISLSYVGIWMLNAGFAHAVSFYQADTGIKTGYGASTGLGGGHNDNASKINKVDIPKPNVNLGESNVGNNSSSNNTLSGKGVNFGANATETALNKGADATETALNKGAEAGEAVLNTGADLFNKTTGAITSIGNKMKPKKNVVSSGTGETSYTGWAGVYAFFFAVLMYTSIYLLLVQQAFTLITLLPDQILRWIGGTPEQLGKESSQWGKGLADEGKKAGEGAQGAVSGAGKQLQGGAIKGVMAAKKGMGGSAEGEAEAKSGD